MQTVIFRDLGLIDYQEAWDLQENIFGEQLSIKSANRVADSSHLQATTHHLFFCEHPHVFTLGKSGDEKNLLVNEQALKEKQAKFYKINRGGDITYHGPGQLVGYPILDLELFFTDIHKYMRLLEESVILTLKEYGITSGRIVGKTGVWLDPDHKGKARKICALGVRCSRWVTMHGFAFNVNSDLNYFNLIIPCGITDGAVTSLEKELGRKVDMDEVKQKMLLHLQQLFGFRLS